MQTTKRSVSVVTSSLKRTLASGQKRNFSSGIVNNGVNTEKWAAQLNASLKDVDPELFDIIEHEKNRQYKGLQLIPSENFTSKAVLDALGSVMQNKYSEGYPGKRYYGGNEYIDMSESLCQKRALEAFNLDPKEWGVNVQSLSGSPANFYVYTALLQPHDRILSLDLPHGGHLSHGYQTPTKKISAVSIYFETLGYRLNEETGLIDYAKMEELADYYRPKLVVAGASAYSRLIDYAAFRKVCDKHNAYLVSDMAHISGLVAAGVIPSPFEHSHVVTTTTHKSLRGPRGAMIFYRKSIEGLEDKINAAVFPGHQGGPHNHTISALAVALKMATTPEYKEYQEQVLKNCKVLTEEMKKLGYKIVSDGTDNHLLLVDLRNKGVDGARVEAVLERSSIAVNKNTVPGDKSAMVPGGIRMGSPALTTRGFLETDFAQVAQFVHEGIQIAQKTKVELEKQGLKKVKDFKDHLDQNPDAVGITQLRNKIESFSKSFPSIGFDKEFMKYK
ncbi:hydroxymethyltransferase [Naegleria gruberi]|uniref:Serine hydroxymethyltransferase n=1 Tax=Naegleria gruberi TaxID=5762 RepID=D2UYA5_NAEGR|nr:hydroxymethyltransferase [Naegleria gruberi]EFC50438.1 hydroxymethyltransferase [Naegleria gruberi]|eukprot:XP_002683182.1 hydroxymethyltransferase [Naegleria gruberi strain NEG-M]